jgi:hypothetical protein
MKTAYWDSGLRWDDQNLRWGSPSYLLEPGDHGYVPPLAPINEPTIRTKKHKMKTNSYYPSRQGDQIVWLGNFSNKLPGYATALGLTAGQSTAAVADCGWLIYFMGSWLPNVRAWSLACTDALGEAQIGSGSAAQVLPVFAAPALPTGVVAVNPGAQNRIFALVQLIKDGGKCTDTIASNLGIVGSEQVAPNITALQPVISAAIVNNQVLVKWGWGGNRGSLAMCEIQVDRGDGKGFVPLAFDTTPNYTDTQPFPATPAKWTYRAIYRVGDGQVGSWSAPASITVSA